MDILSYEGDVCCNLICNLLSIMDLNNIRSIEIQYHCEGQVICIQQINNRFDQSSNETKKK